MRSRVQVSLPLLKKKGTYLKKASALSFCILQPGFRGVTPDRTEAARSKGSVVDHLRLDESVVIGRADLTVDPPPLERQCDAEDPIQHERHPGIG